MIVKNFGLENSRLSLLGFRNCIDYTRQQYLFFFVVSECVFFYALALQSRKTQAEEYWTNYFFGESESQPGKISLVEYRNIS